MKVEERKELEHFSPRKNAFANVEELHVTRKKNKRRDYDESCDNM